VAYGGKQGERVIWKTRPFMFWKGKEYALRWILDLLVHSQEVASIIAHRIVARFRGERHFKPDTP
jgi:hypothetical protein